jgi:hypothetical protein
VVKAPSQNAARLRITLLDIDPAPWRSVEVPLSMTVKGLHDTIQAAFLWFDCHLWEFEIAGRRYGIPMDDAFGGERTHDAGAARLTELRDAGASEFLYIYDMGDSWEHLVEVVDLFDAPEISQLPRFLDGKWRAPPEDIGGAPGFEMFLEAMADQDHDEHDDLMDWHGGPFDPEDTDTQSIESRMRRLAGEQRPKA